MQLTELFLIFGLVLLGWFWVDSGKVAERARVIGFQLCNKNNMQFLDETVHLSRLYIARNQHGQFKLTRKYRFEFTNNEYRRYKGELVFAGMSLVKSYMDAFPESFDGQSNDTLL